MKRWRVAITHEYEIAWKRVLHYFDLHLNKRLNKQPPCYLLNALRRRQVTVMASRITGQSNVCSTVCSDCQQRNTKGPRYCPFVMRIHCDQWFPTQMTWKMLLFDDVIMDWRIPWRHMYYITQYTHYITAINQTILERGRNVGIPLVSLLSLVRFLSTTSNGSWCIGIKG